MSAAVQQAENDAHADFAVPLDSLLADAANGSLGRFLPGTEGLLLGAALARQPRTVARRLSGLAADLGRIAVGMSEIEPSRRDKRFKDPAWSGNPFFRRCMQGYLASAGTLQQLFDDVDLDQQSERRLQLVLDNIIGAAAPSNVLWLNPSALKAIIDTGGTSVLHGARNFCRDMARAPRVPAMVDASKFAVGESLATTPGEVVLRTPEFELIQYRPTTAEVRKVPLLMVPPMINKFYILDVAAGRSMVEYLVAQGQQVFMISWRNPTARHAGWGMDTYINAVLEAMAVTRQICRVDSTIVHGTCAGGIISAMTAAYLARMERADELEALVLGVTLLDQADGGTTGALMDRARADAAIAVSSAIGYLDGRNLAEVFAWLRPTDLVWSFWVNNYLLGKAPPAFDVLYWNSDTTRMPARLHHDFLDLAVNNSLVTADQATALGEPIDLAEVTQDAYLIGGETDHITPWQSCYRTTGLLGGKSRFVLSTGGHIAAQVLPPDNAKASFRSIEDNPSEPEDFAAQADDHEGSWWIDYAAWLGARSGETKNAPKTLGRGRFKPLGAAPGTYVLDK
ncbi:PHA/PHB synthase family protein [Salinisphaera aquimarina]|uniref:PHA/PHB synthase family protein n=1 Tax=Salinisphaera aquimarina TaxID=2094031 RepID=A0ABV7EVQ3_9GAMM